jgi:hypothetical protein
MDSFPPPLIRARALMLESLACEQAQRLQYVDVSLRRSELAQSPSLRPALRYALTKHTYL